jgi:hypothetical protein
MNDHVSESDGMQDVEIKLGRHGATTVVVAGVDVAPYCSGITLHADVARRPTLTLELEPRRMQFAGRADIVVEGEVWDLLVAAGWTPPGARE